jgi:integrase
MNRPVFKSCLARRMDEFVEFKTSQGYDYVLAARALRHFDRFLLRSGHKLRKLTPETLGHYAAEISGLKLATRRGFLLSARAFARWLSLLIPGSSAAVDIPAQKPAPACHHLYSREEAAAIIRNARRLDASRRPPLPGCHATLVGLLYATGLRVGEALALNVGDIDPAAGRLAVRRGKMGKARSLALSPSTAAALGRYLDARLGFRPSGRDAPLFLDSRGGRLPYHTANRQFRSLRGAAAPAADGRRPPRLHDFRHTFACECLRRWRAEGADVNARLPILAAALGHTSVHDSQTYIRAAAQDLQAAAARFHEFIKNNNQGAPR